MPCSDLGLKSGLCVPAVGTNPSGVAEAQPVVLLSTADCPLAAKEVVVYDTKKVFNVPSLETAGPSGSPTSCGSTSQSSFN